MRGGHLQRRLPKAIGLVNGFLAPPVEKQRHAVPEPLSGRPVEARPAVCVGYVGLSPVIEKQFHALLVIPGGSQNERRAAILSSFSECREDA